MLDTDVKENIYYTVNRADTAYIHQEHIFEKIDDAIKERETSSKIIRRSADSLLFLMKQARKRKQNITHFTENHPQINEDFT